MGNRKRTLLNRQTDQFSSTFSATLMNLSETGRSRKQLLSMLADGALAILALWLAYSLRLDEPFSNLHASWYIFLLMPIVTVGVFGAFGVYRWVIRSTNQRLFKQLVKCCFVSSLTLLVIFSLSPPDMTNPRSLFVIYGLLLLFGSGGVRLLWRSFFDVDDRGLPIAVYGAGSAGLQLVSLSRAGNEYRPMVFIDDNPALRGSTLSGLPVLSGNNSDLKSALKRYDVNCVVLAMPSLSSMGYQKKLDFLGKLEYPVLTMPSVSELMTGVARVDDIRDVSINDILGRSEVKPDIDLMCLRVTGKTVLVTGGGGSIGSELCRQIVTLAPKKLIVLDNTEVNLYHITEEINTLLATIAEDRVSAFLPVLGSVANVTRINRLMSEESVDTVFHAAAYKHVPIIEAQPDQGAGINVFGTLTVLEASISHGVLDFVLISTDKAVRPANAMGASKRVAELVLQAKARETSRTRISMVRFGNVLGSSGSVVPKFKKQIETGGPITLTHSDITRYFMTIPEAAQLVLQASAIARGGDVFVLDMGQPVRIEELAITMVRLYGKRLYRDTGHQGDIQIVVEGLRPGEKLYEELFINNSHQQTQVVKIFTANEVWLNWDKLGPHLEELRKSVDSQQGAEVREQLMRLAFTGGELQPALTGNSEKNNLTELA